MDIILSQEKGVRFAANLAEQGPIPPLHKCRGPPEILMNVQRGDVVLVDYPYAAGGGTKVRPVLVIQNDRDNQRLLNTIVAQITSVTRRTLEPTQLVIELATPDGQQSGLRQDSVVNCVNLLTLDKGMVLRKLGNLSDTLMQKINNCLKAALALP